jgi:hypothetical protein
MPLGSNKATMANQSVSPFDFYRCVPASVLKWHQSR